MGKVFTWDEIEHGHVPEASAFGYIVNRLRGSLAFYSAITTAVLCGSIVRGDSTIRSDIDCLVLYRSEEERTAFAIMQRMSQLAAGYDVPLTFIPSSIEIAATKMHHLGPSFWRHIARSAQAGGVIKGWPMVVHTRSESEELESYVRFKLYKLESAWAEYPGKSPAEQAQVLQKMLEAPLHVARRVVQGLFSGDADSKDGVAQEYQKHLTALAGQLRSLVSLDREYTTMLHRQLKSRNEADYKDVLKYLEEHVFESIAFVKRNALFIARFSAP